MEGTPQRTSLTTLGRALIQACRGRHIYGQQGRFNTNRGSGSPTHRWPNLERLSTSSASRFTKGQIVVIYDKENDCVGEGVVSELEVGDLLEGNKYANWESRTWEPSKENDDKILVSSAMTTWTNPTVRSTPMCTVHGLRVEKEIRIPPDEVYHIRPHLQEEGSPEQ